MISSLLMSEPAHTSVRMNDIALNDAFDLKFLGVTKKTN